MLPIQAPHSSLQNLQKVKWKLYLESYQTGRKTKKYCHGYRKWMSKAIMIKLEQYLGSHMKIQANGFDQYLIIGLHPFTNGFFGSWVSVGNSIYFTRYNSNSALTALLSLAQAKAH